MHDDPTIARDPSTLREPPREPPREPRQRWRLVLARAADAPSQTQRELAEAWQVAITASGLPLARTEGASPRPRISFGAPLPASMAADGELIDIVLTERWPIWRVRESLTGVMPVGWRLVELQDVWLAGPPLAGRIAAADYRIELAIGPRSVATDANALRHACESLLAATSILRERPKGGGVVTYDLRPLVIDVRVLTDGPPIVLRTRTCFHPELGTGRPDEVVGALSAAVGAPLEIGAIVRERLLLAEELSEPTGAG